MKKDLNRTLRLLALFRLCLNTLFIMPVIVPFFYSRGLSQTGIGVLQAIFMSVAFLAEVPTGYIADKIGRKKSMQLGTLITAVGFVIYAFSYPFWQLVLSESLIGLGISFVSGCESAYLYEILRANKLEDQASRYDGRLAAYGAIGAAVSGLVGAILAAKFGFTLVLLVDAFVMLIGVIVASRLPTEPSNVKNMKLQAHPFRDIARVTRYSLHEHKEVKWLILFAAIAGVSTHTAVWLLQPAYARAGVPLVWYGVIWAAINLLLAFFSHSAGRTIKKFGEWNVAWLIILSMVMAYVVLGVSSSQLALLSISGLYWTRGLTLPLVLKLINERIDSAYRATVLSVRALTHRALYIIMNPILGWLVDHKSLSFAFLTSALIYGTLGCFALAKILKFVFRKQQDLA